MTENNWNSTAEELLDAAVIAAHAGNLTETRELAERVLERRPSDAEAQALLVLESGMADQVRRLTILFADVVGSTAIANQLEPERYRTLMGYYEQAVIQAVELDNGGNLVRFSGDGALALFGYPVPREGDGRRAVSAGLALVGYLAEADAAITERFGQQLAARVAIHRGLVYLEQGTGEIYGPAPNLTARLQDLAGTNEVLITDVMRDLVGDAIAYEEREPQIVKGFEKPCTFVRVLRLTAPAERGHSMTTPFVGRQAELSLLATTSDPVRAEGTAVVVAGEAGIGKSRLVTEFGRSLQQRGIKVLHSPSGGGMVAAHLGSFRAVLEEHLELGSVRWSVPRWQRLREWLGAEDEIVPYLALVLGIPPKLCAPPEQDARMLYAGVIESIRTALERIAAESPTLLIADDVHLADSASQEAFRILIERPIENLSLVATARPGTVDHWPQVMTLGPLSGDERIALASTLAGVSDDGLIARLVERSDGVPLYLEELARQGWREESVPTDVQDLLADSAVPDVLYEPLLAALYRDPENVDLAQFAATMGRSIDLGLLASVLRVSPSELGARLTNLLDNGVLEVALETQELRFHHALIRDLAYDLQPRGIRELRHARIAEVLLEQSDAFGDPPRWGEIAFHSECGNRPDEAILAYGHSADDLRQAGALGQARQQIDRAIALAVEDSAHELTEIDLRLRRSFLTVSMEGFAAPSAVADLERCASLVDGRDRLPQQISVLTSTWAFRGVRGELGAQRAVSNQLAEIVQGSPGLAAQNLASFGMVDFFEGQHASAYDQLGRALEALNDSPPIESESAGWHVPNSPDVSICTHLGVSAWFAGQPSFEDHFAEAERLAAAADFPTNAFGRCYCLSYRGWVYTEEHRFEEAKLAFDELLRLAGQHGFDFWSITGAIHSAVADGRAALADGGAKAETLVAMAGQIGAVTDFWTGLQTRLFEPYPRTWCAALLAAGGAPEAESAFEAALGLMDTLGIRFYEAEALRLRGEFTERADLANQALAVAQGQHAMPFMLRAALDVADAKAGSDPARLLGLQDLVPANAPFKEMTRLKSLTT